MSTQGNGSGGNGHNATHDASVSAESEGGAAVFGAAPPPGQLTKKDFVSNQEVRWCPGCGDYAILNNVQKVMPEAGPGDCDRNQISESRSERVGDYWRRRRAFDRWQPFHARAQAQPRHQLHSLQ